MSTKMTPQFAPLRRLEELDALLRQVAEKVGLSEHFACGAAGGGWTWIWSDLPPPSSDSPSRIGEVHFAARLAPEFPSASIEGAGIEASITALAWLVARPDIAWSRTYLSLYLSPETPLSDEIAESFAYGLDRAWGEVRKATESLESHAEQRARMKSLLMQPTEARNPLHV